MEIIKTNKDEKQSGFVFLQDLETDCNCSWDCVDPFSFHLDNIVILDFIKVGYKRTHLTKRNQFKR